MMSYCLFFLNDIGIISSNHTHLKTAFEKVQCLSSVAFHYTIFVLKIKKQLTPKTNKFIQPVIIQRIKNARTHTHTANVNSEYDTFVSVALGSGQLIHI